MPIELPSNQKYDQVKVRSVDLDAPTLVDRIGLQLLDHLIACPTCAAIFAAQQVSIDEAGCVDGKRIVSQSRLSWQERRSLLALSHLGEETLDDYLFERLTSDEHAALQHHAASCSQCAEKLRAREALVAGIKRSFRKREEDLKNSAIPEAVVVVRFPSPALKARSKKNRHGPPNP